MGNLVDLKTTPEHPTPTLGTLVTHAIVSWSSEEIENVDASSEIHMQQSGEPLLQVAAIEFQLNQSAFIEMLVVKVLHDVMTRYTPLKTKAIFNTRRTPRCRFQILLYLSLKDSGVCLKTTLLIQICTKAISQNASLCTQPTSAPQACR